MTGVRSVVFWLGLEIRKFLKSGQRFKVPGAPKTNVRVRVRRGVVQIQSEDAGIGTIVPVAAA